MSFNKHGRQYDIVVFGATGYTGLLTAEHITINFPSNLQWAVAGRSPNKLKQVVSRCKFLNPDRVQPDIEVCNIDDKELAVLARKTFCLISAVGPYALYGEHAFKACAEAGTHYVDCTAEVPWTLAMIKKYEATARTSGACMFPQTGLAVPSDILTWVMATEARSKLSSKISDVVMDLHELHSTTSGGTLASILNFFDFFSFGDIYRSNKPYALSPVTNEHPLPKWPIWSAITGLYRVPRLGLLSSSPTGNANAAIVFRTWGLMKIEPELQNEFYGPNFSYQEFVYAGNVLRGVMGHCILLTVVVLLFLPPFRALLRLFISKPGEGPDKEVARKEIIEFRAIAETDVEPKINKRMFGRLSYTGSMYFLTAAVLAEAAGTLLQGGRQGLKGGVYTPACLGLIYVNRLRRAGFQIESGFESMFPQH